MSETFARAVQRLRTRTPSPLRSARAALVVLSAGLLVGLASPDSVPAQLDRDEAKAFDDRFEELADIEGDPDDHLEADAEDDEAFEDECGDLADDAQDDTDAADEADEADDGTDRGSDPEDGGDLDADGEGDDEADAGAEDPTEDEDDTETSEDEDEDAGDCEEQTVDAPVRRALDARARLSRSRGRPPAVIASGTIRRRGVRAVRLTVYRATRNGRWRNVATRTAPVRHRRFRAPVARWRAGARYRVDVRQATRGRRGARRGRAGRAGLSNPAGNRTRAAELRAEARLFQTPPPGPLPDGSVIATETPTERALVRALQARLVVAGFATPVTGRFDGATEQSVIRFQRAHGLLVDGVVGRQTATALSVYR